MLACSTSHASLHRYHFNFNSWRGSGGDAAAGLALPVEAAAAAVQGTLAVLLGGVHATP